MTLDRFGFGFSLIVALVACGSDEPVEDTSSSSSTTSSSGGAGGAGAGGEASTSSAGGMGGGGSLPLAGFGTVSGDCDELDPSELMAMSSPITLSNAIDFPMTSYMRADLTPGGQTLFDDPNAGGSSKDSEIFAYEVLARCELASLLKTETNIMYEAMGPITDMLVEVDGLKIGVSVVRAFKFNGDYTLQDALPIITDKLDDIQQSSANVSPVDAWEKQILSVIAEKPENAAVVMDALTQVAPATRGDTVVLITTTDGEDAFIY